MPQDRHEISRLLSGRPHLTVQEKEAVLDNVLQAVAAESDATQPRFGRSLVARRAAVAAVLTVLLAVPAVWWIVRSGASSGSGTTAEFTPRGGDSDGHFSLKCLSGERAAACKIGDTLTFQVTSTAEMPYFAAFARHLGDDLVIWYFPVGGGGSERPATDGTRHGILGKGIRIGADHPAGSYEVYGVFSDKPLSRDGVKALFGDRFEVKPVPGTRVSKLKFSVESRP